ncbi:MAG: homoserine dehydrogenase [Blastocatellia bacterium]|nr:homoserine dehydrogenase [Blastocatellia bacterium]
MSEREIRVAIAGFGTVGQAVIRLLREEASRYREEIGVPLRLAVVLDRSIRRKDTRLLDSSVVMTDSLDQFFQTPADIVVELIGGHEPADSIITAGLQQGKAVVTANKLLLAQHARRYFQLARDHNAYLGFEAAVAGGIPILRVLRRALFADRIVRLRGILNGTCNFILSEMSQSGRDFQDVLKEAQARGYAEADPWLDISGRDTTDKLSILSLLAFGKTSQPEKIPTLGIQAISFVDFLYANKLDYTIKLLGVAQRNGDEITLRVSPFLTHRRLPLAAIGGALNAVEVTGNKLGSAMFTGRGAGGDPTAVSVVADILNAALWKQEAAPFYLQPVFHRDSAESPDTADPATTESTEVYPFFLRFFVKDRTGIIAEVASILARHQININSLWQEPWPDLSNLPFVITIEPTLFSTMQRALAELSQLEFNRVPPLALPMLNE